METAKSLTTGASQVKDVVNASIVKNADVSNIKIQQGAQQINKEIDTWKKSTTGLVETSWNIPKAIMMNDFNKDNVLKFLN